MLIAVSFAEWILNARKGQKLIFFAVEEYIELLNAVCLIKFEINNEMDYIEWKFWNLNFSIERKCSNYVRILFQRMEFLEALPILYIF